MRRAMVRMTKDVEEGKLKSEDVTEELVNSYLDTWDIPDPDLLIRTSGEQRLSNFLLWQLAYTEFLFMEVLWPDFNRDELVRAIRQYNGRERRSAVFKEGYYVLDTIGQRHCFSHCGFLTIMARRQYMVFGCIPLSLIGLYELYKTMRIERTFPGWIGCITTVLYCLLLHENAGGHFTGNPFMAVIAWFLVIVLYTCLPFPNLKQSRLLFPFLD